jgi:hypothetical protein
MCPWIGEALEDAFENNAPEVHSYLHLGTGEVLRVVDGIADPQMHSRIAADASYVRVEPVSSREQYRWMERFIQMLDPGDLRDELVLAIDGRGAFRRFKDVLMVNATERERWFAFRSERLRVFMEAWLEAHALRAVPRAVTAAPAPTKDQASEPPPVSQDQLAAGVPGTPSGCADNSRRRHHARKHATSIGCSPSRSSSRRAACPEATRSATKRARQGRDAPEGARALRSSSAPPSSAPEDGRGAEKTLPS